jgi:hypothetical protein
MKPRIQCVLTQWIPGFIASGSGPIVMSTGIHAVSLVPRLVPCG